MNTNELRPSDEKAHPEIATGSSQIKPVGKPVADLPTERTAGREAPERIWLQWKPHDCWESSWHDGSVFDDDVEYVRADRVTTPASAGARGDAPERIWLQIDPNEDEQTWSQHRVDDADVEYVRAEAKGLVPSEDLAVAVATVKWFGGYLTPDLRDRTDGKTWRQVFDEAVDTLSLAAAPPAGGSDAGTWEVYENAAGTLGVQNRRLSRHFGLAPHAPTRNDLERLAETLNNAWNEAAAALARRAPEGARRTVLATCECGRGPRSILDFRDSAGVRSWRLATTCTECLPDYTNATAPGGAA